MIEENRIILINIYSLMNNIWLEFTFTTKAKRWTSLNLSIGGASGSSGSGSSSSPLYAKKEGSPVNATIILDARFWYSSDINGTARKT